LATLAGGDGLLGGLGADDDQDLVLGDHLGVGLDRRFGLGFVVLDHQFDGILFAAHIQTAGP
jgi:hypothetical protein